MVKLERLYAYVYYRLMRWSARIDADASHHHSAVLMISFVDIMLLLGPLLMLLYWIGFTPGGASIKFVSVGICFLLIAINYFHFVFQKRYIRIYNDFSKEDERSDQLGEFFVAMLVIAAPLIFIGLMILAASKE